MIFCAAHFELPTSLSSRLVLPAPRQNMAAGFWWSCPRSPPCNRTQTPGYWFRPWRSALNPGAHHDQTPLSRNWHREVHVACFVTLWRLYIVINYFSSIKKVKRPYLYWHFYGVFFICLFFVFLIFIFSFVWYLLFNYWCLLLFNFFYETLYIVYLSSWWFYDVYAYKYSWRSITVPYMQNHLCQLIAC